MKREILGMVLCGGQSRRMGEDKAELEIRPGLTQLEYSLSLLGQFCLRVSVSVGPQGRHRRGLPDGVEEVFDLEEVEGPFSGVLAGLRRAGGWPLLVVACDMPYLEPAVLLQLVSRRNPQKLATCFVAADGKPDPMCALFEAGSWAALEDLAANGRLSLRRFLEDGMVEKILPADPQFLASVNDPEGLSAARRHFML